MFRFLREDLRRCCDKGHFAWYEPSLLSIVCYRLGQCQTIPQAIPVSSYAAFYPFQYDNNSAYRHPSS